MLIIEIEKEYQVPQEWADVTMEKYIKSIPILKSMPTKLYTLFFGKEEEKKEVEGTINQEDNLEFANFYKKWVSYWAEIPEDIIGQLPIESEHGIGVINLYTMLLKFMYMPTEKECPAIERIIYKGYSYMTPKAEMADASFDEFYEGVELKRIQGELKKDNSEILPLLTAIIYRPAKVKYRHFFDKLMGTKKEYYIEPYDSVKVKARAEEFKHLTMDKVWGAYFFFIQSKLLYFGNAISSLKEEGKKAEFPEFANLDGF